MGSTDACIDATGGDFYVFNDPMCLNRNVSSGNRERFIGNIIVNFEPAEQIE